MFRLGAVLSLLLFACEGQIEDPGVESFDAGTTTVDAEPQLLGDAAEAAVDAGESNPDAAPAADVLATETGCFFTSQLGQPLYTVNIGEPGAEYRWIRIEYHVVHGGWRQDVFDREVLNHNLMGLSRKDPEFVGRYILGNAARIQPAKPNLDRKSLFYGRVDLEPRPQGQGWMGYTGWRTPFNWVPGETYHVQVELNAATKKQRLVVTHSSGAPSATTVGDIAYWEPSLSAATFELELGGFESDGREVQAAGWQFCDLSVWAKLF